MLPHSELTIVFDVRVDGKLGAIVFGNIFKQAGHEQLPD